MNFSIILASRERVSLLSSFLESLLQNTHDLSKIEVLIGIDYDDTASCEAEINLSAKYSFVRFYKRHRSKHINKDYLNWMYQFSSGKFIIACNDDVEVRTKDWDKITLEVLDKYLEDKLDGIVYGFIEDGLVNRHNLNYSCFPLVSKKAVEAVGWVLPPRFLSWNADIAAWRVYREIGRVCHIPVLFDHISHHTGKRARDNISHHMEMLDLESGMQGCNYDINEDVNRLYKSVGNWLPIGKNGIVYSILVATRERPELLESFIESVEKNTICKKSVEICIGYDSDDKQTYAQCSKLSRKFGSLVKFYGRQRSNMLNRDYYNWLSRFSSGSFLIICDDDCRIVTEGWDQHLTAKLKNYLKDKPDGIIYGKINDGCNMNYTRFPLISKNATLVLDYLVHPEFPARGAEIHLGRLYTYVNRVLDLENIVFDHVSYHSKKRGMDNVNAHIQRISSRMINDPNVMDITQDALKINNFIHSFALNKEIVVTKKPNILFVTEKWCDGNPQAGITNSHHNLFGSLSVSGVADYNCLHFDEYFVKYGRNLDNELLRYCKEEKPDVIVSTYLCHPAHLNVSQGTWLKIKDMGIPIVFIWFDLVVPFVADIANNLSSCSDLNVGLDICDFNAKYPNKFMPMWTPQDIRYYFNPHSARDIDVCFLGSISGYGDRLSAIETLRNNGVDVIQMGGQREQPLPLEAYVSIMQRAKITLNFSRYRSAPHLFQAKGRIFEATFCGSMLMDADNDQTKKWFNPGENYISFVDNQDLLKKVKYYLHNTSEREKIAESGWLCATKRYAPKNFWQSILSKVRVM